MVTGKDVEGWLGIYLFKPFSRLAAAKGLWRPPLSSPAPFFKEGPSLIPESGA